MTSTSPTRPSRYSIPTPETGLAEWASRIKAIQQQVDADEEDEQRKLEEEIAASRMARLRRSRGLGQESPSRSSFDLDRLKQDIPPSTREDDESADVDRVRPSADRKQSQRDALDRLVGGGSSASFTEPRTNAAAPAKRAGPMSLAAFMGGRATGPRLNKHAPQQDALDPTQFEQRTRIDAPHPVFGRGGIAMQGVAMPGLAKKASSPSLQQTPTAEPLVQRHRRQSSPSKVEDRKPEPPQTSGILRDRNISPPSGSIYSSSPVAVSSRLSTPAVVSRYTESLQDRPQSSHRSKSRDRERSKSRDRARSKSRDRVTSTSTVSERAFSDAGSSRYSASHESQPRTPSRDVISPEPTTASSRPVAPLAAQTPSSPPQKSPVSTHSLARPVRPEPKFSPSGPQIPSNEKAAAAFLKPPPQKEPTPSLSRLKGRGFVQNMVKASQQLESVPPVPSMPGNAGAVKRSSVLDRWPGSPKSPTTSSPPPKSTPKSQKPTPPRKAVTVDENPTIIEPKPKPAQLRSVKSMTSTIPSQFTGKSSSSNASSNVSSIHPQTTGGLGSATTLMIIQPAPTGGEQAPVREVDELCLKPRGGTPTKPSSHTELPAATGKPLIHPTRDRAKKPRKGRDNVKVDESTKVHAKPVPVAREPSRSPVPTAARPATVLPPPLSKPSLSAPAKLEDPSPSPTRPSRVTDRWLNQTVIGVKPVGVNSQLPDAEQPKPSGMVGRRALPGLAVPTDTNSPAPASRSLPSPKLEPPPSPRSAETTPSPPSSGRKEDKRPSRHARIPSTGNRATVMDVAQAFDEVASTPAEPARVVASSHEEHPPSPEAIKFPPSPVASQPLPRSPQSLGAPAGERAERRRSSYDKYSSFMMPPVKEEATPLPTPANTLPRTGSSPGAETPDQQVLRDHLERAAQNQVEEIKTSVPQIVHFAHNDGPLPSFNIHDILNSRGQRTSIANEVQTISVEVLIIQGSNAQPLTQDTHVFYDREHLAVIHRGKSKSTGLVSTHVWSWQGKHVTPDERQERKINDVAKRYGTTPIPVHQNAESIDLVEVLRGKLVTRQGTRAHWSSDNTSMHAVRSLYGATFVDELDLSVKNLCSGFSYCVTVLGSVYVWHGCGAVPSERQAARAYAKTLGSDIVELSQGESDDDEMFWMIFGDDNFAKADYWKWRRDAVEIEPAIWKVDTQAQEAIVPLESFPHGPILKKSVLVLDCIWELFVYVGLDARGKREDIKLAVSMAKELANTVAPTRPYTPTVHVLVLPSQIPIDLKHHFRGFDEAILNNDNIPDHMNLLPIPDALDHLRRKSWETTVLKDEEMLPLGLDASKVASVM